MSKVYSKAALSFEAQVALLQSRGMQIADVAAAISTLKRVSYYRLSAYWYPFRSAHDKFGSDATFERAVWLYEFDRRLRLLALDAIERVEIELRTSVTYVLGHKYGALALEDAARFRPGFDHLKWRRENLLPEIERSADKESFLIHFRTNYLGFPSIPIWMASEVMSLGTLSRLMKGMIADDQNAVLARWGLHHTVAESWFHCIAYVRNVCAHHARLWNRDLAIKPMIPKKDPSWDAIVNNRRVFSVLCMLRQLTRDHGAGDDWSRAATALLREMDGKVAYQNAMGMPPTWSETRFWKSTT